MAVALARARRYPGRRDSGYHNLTVSDSALVLGMISDRDSELIGVTANWWPGPLELARSP